MTIEQEQEEAEMFRWFFRNPGGKMMWLIKGCSENDNNDIPAWKNRIRQAWEESPK